MPRKLLLTSFTTWKEHHQSNSSDDLLQAISRIDRFFCSLHYLKRLPVDFQLAPQRAIREVNEVQPDVTVLCGMAEYRTKMTVESRAVVENETLRTDIDLDALTSGLAKTDISHATGTFVCNMLYHSMLKHLRDNRSGQSCLFVHVPVLTSDNLHPIRADFEVMIDKLSA